MASDKDLAPELETSDNSISMVDVLRHEEELEADVNAVLGNSDATNCTYPLGYVNRQALYACYTCCTSEPAGICLACSLECHDGHDLYELYTKRNFRCDCGNDKFPNLKCKLYESKEPTNSRNQYNQNFTGKYCTCSRPYPDPEDEIEDEMIQCVVCEDWYHGRHLGSDIPKSSDDYDEVICRSCMQKYDFLWAYHLKSNETQKVVKSETNNDVDVLVSQSETNNTNSAEVTNDGDRVKDNNSVNDESIIKDDLKDSETEIENKNSLSVKCDGDSNCDDVTEKCLLKELLRRETTHGDDSVFWQSGWRKKLCRCATCMKMYKEREITYLLDDEDTVHEYEARGKANHTTSSGYDRGIQALNNMDRVQQVEVLHGFNDLKSELSDYLKKFAENGKVVREEDIREFFTTMEARKRQRTAAPMQYFCK